MGYGNPQGATLSKTEEGGQVTGIGPGGTRKTSVAPQIASPAPPPAPAATPPGPGVETKDASDDDMEKCKTMTKADPTDRSLLDLAMHEHPAAMHLVKAMPIGTIEPFHDELMVKSERGWLPIGDRSLLFPDDELNKGAIYIGPHGGKWADPKHTIPYKEAKHGGDRPEPKSAKIADADHDDVRALHMHIDNHEHLTNETMHHPNPWGRGEGHTSQTMRGAIHKNLANKMGSGKYDHALATKMWGHLADRASKEAAKQGGKSGHAFSPEVRRRVAHDLADQFHAQAKAGEMDHHLNKKNSKIMHGSLKNDPNLLANAKAAHAKARGETVAKEPKRKPEPGSHIKIPITSHPDALKPEAWAHLTHSMSKQDHKDTAAAHARLARETAEEHEKYRKNAIANHGQSEGLTSGGVDAKFPQATNDALRRLNAKKNFHLDASVKHHEASGARKPWLDAEHGGKVFHRSSEDRAVHQRIHGTSEPAEAPKSTEPGSPPTLGKTSSGKDILKRASPHTPKQWVESHKGWSQQDHEEARMAHGKAAISYPAGSDQAKYHGAMATAHKAMATAHSRTVKLADGRTLDGTQGVHLQHDVHESVNTARKHWTSLRSEGGDVKKSDRKALDLIKSHMADEGTMIRQGALTIPQGPDYHARATQSTRPPRFGFPQPEAQAKSSAPGEATEVPLQRMGREGQLVRPNHGLRFPKPE